MITILHVIFNLSVYFIIGLFIPVSYIDLFLVLFAELIDLDHLPSKPVYKKGRNSFETHFLHKRVFIVLIIALTMLFIRPIMFLGIGILLHFFLDYLDNKIENNRKK